MIRTNLLSAVQQNRPKKLILNLQQVPYMDSSAIAILVEMLKEMRKTGGRLMLVDLQPRVKGLLEIARLDAIFSICRFCSALLTMRRVERRCSSRAFMAAVMSF